MKAADTNEIVRAFSFGDGVMSHMPYVCEDPSGGIAMSCCMKVGGIWKVHLFKDGEWKRVCTGLSGPSVECSPHMWYDDARNRWMMSFIGGAAGFDDPSLRMYVVDGPLTGLCKVDRTVSADAGYVFKNLSVFCGRKGPIYRSSAGSGMTSIGINGSEFIYRVTGNANAPYQMIVSGSMDEGHGGGLFTWVVDPMERRLFSLEVEGEVAYKACLFGDLCLYARKSGDGFEDRSIVCTRDFELREIPFDDNIEIA